MNGAHDCGGMMGFGPVVVEANEPVFHAPWEARAFALMSAAGDVGGWSIDEDRAACEAMHPGHYIQSSYYEHWLHGLETLLANHGLATAEEIASGQSSSPGKPVAPTAASEVWPGVTAAGSYVRTVERQPVFKPGGLVRTRQLNPAHHTRLPRYLRGQQGEVISCHGAHVFPDSNAQRRGEDPQFLYTVRFRAADVWGRPSRDLIHADLWEPYLEAC
ncbi:nitrile hydratase subunit beta [Aestuariivirga sp.]|uniref:nitrile hydratase subunit beta n=1 Tax=Aestuariivirga sp. TaxID=2650926 RepID=UPI003BAAD215